MIDIISRSRKPLFKALSVHRVQAEQPLYTGVRTYRLPLFCQFVCLLCTTVHVYRSWVAMTLREPYVADSHEPEIYTSTRAGVVAWDILHRRTCRVGGSCRVTVALVSYFKYGGISWRFVFVVFFSNAHDLLQV